MNWLFNLDNLSRKEKELRELVSNTAFASVNQAAKPLHWCQMTQTQMGANLSRIFLDASISIPPPPFSKENFFDLSVGGGGDYNCKTTEKKRISGLKFYFVLITWFQSDRQGQLQNWCWPNVDYPPTHFPLPLKTLQETYNLLLKYDACFVNQPNEKTDSFVRKESF